jgi:hypothetical protein
MKNKLDIFLEKLIKEATYTRNDILKVIQKESTITVERISGGKTSVLEIAPTNISDDNIITGTTKDGSEVNCNLEDVLQTSTNLKEGFKPYNNWDKSKSRKWADEKTAGEFDQGDYYEVENGHLVGVDDYDKWEHGEILGRYNSKGEKLNEVVKIKADNLNNIDPSKIEKTAEKTDIFIEDDIPEDELDGKWIDPAGGIHDDDEEDPAHMYKSEEIDERNKREEAIYNFKSWADQLDIDLGKESAYGKDIKTFNVSIENKPVTVMVEPDGTIKMGGHTLKSFEDLQNIVEFYKDMSS